MNPQATTTDELTFTRPQGELEKQVLTAEAVEFLTELV
ncbi:malate synthase, partial [Salmonella enterica subsp. enterica serovar Schwarzengrund]